MIFGKKHIDEMKKNWDSSVPTFLNEVRMEAFMIVNNMIKKDVARAIGRSSAGMSKYFNGTPLTYGVCIRLLGLTGIQFNELFKKRQTTFLK